MHVHRALRGLLRATSAGVAAPKVSRGRLTSGPAPVGRNADALTA